MSTWVEQLVKPLADNAVGIDPRNSDEFYDLKQEVTKLSGIDYNLIKSKSEIILSQQGKDLRVASYLILARLNLEGYQGFQEALALYDELLSNYGEQLYPQKSQSKIASVQWLNEPRIKHLLKSKLDLKDARQTKKLLKRIETINTHLQEYIKLDTKIFTSITSSLRAAQTQALPAAEVRPVQMNAAANDRGNQLPGQVLCEDELRETTRLQLNYLRQQQQWLRAVGYSRAYRWGGLKALRADNNITSVPAPDEQAVQNLQRIVENGAPGEVLIAAEDLLMMKGGLYYFDLHYYQSIAAKEMGLTDVAAYIEDELKQLLLRFPKWINYSYSNNQPFVSVENRLWLESLLRPSATLASEVAGVEKTLSLNDIVNRYRAEVAGKSLSEKITLLRKSQASDMRGYYQQQLALARFCLEDKRVDLAVPMLEQLAQLINTHQLDVWEPEFAMYVWSELRTAWKLSLPKLNPDMQKQVREKLENLFAKMCVTDLGRASQMKSI
jgi:type VI secretion system protein VasJ